MILSDRDIRKAIEEKRISIDPFDQADIQPSSVDLHVDRLFRTFHNHRYAHIDVKKPMEELTELVEVRDGEAFILHPGEFVLGSTSEYVKLPDDLVARLEGKSSLGRLGLLIHSSLPAEEEILFLHDGQLMLRPIGEIVGKQLEGSVVGFDPDTFEVGYHQVTGWFEGTPDRIFEVTLASGRKVRLTGGHDLFTLNASGDTVKVPIHSIPPGTKVAIPKQIPDIPSEHPVVLNLAELAPEDSHASLVCSGPSVTNAWENDPDLPNALRTIGIVNHVSYYRKRRQLPFSVAKMIGIDKQFGSKDFLSIKQGVHRIPVVLEVDKEIAWLLGIYVAEGYVRRNQVTITNFDPAILDRAQAAFAQIGLRTYRTNHHVTCCSSVMAHLIHWLGMSGKARQKRLPDTVLTWPRHLLGSFLEGFVDGDGSREETRVSLWTGSELLAGDLMFLCQRLGLRASVSHRMREDGPLWQVSVPYREHKLLTAVPLVNELLLDVRRESGMDQETAAEAAGFGYPTQLNNIERGRWPAILKRTLSSLRDAFAGRGVTSQKLDRIVDGDLCWDEVVEVRDTGRIEPVFDLEVRPDGRRIESFVAGYGGILVSNTAGYVDPGFEGHLTLELSNVANLPITIYPGMKIGQISFFKLTSPAENPYGSGKLGSKYQGQRGPTASRYYENF